MSVNDSTNVMWLVKGVAPTNIEEGVEAYPVFCTSKSTSGGQGPSQVPLEIKEDVAIGHTRAEVRPRDETTVVKEALGKDPSVLPVIPQLQEFVKRV